MITAGDVKYEPYLMKIAAITPYMLVLVAGDYSVHSQAIQDTTRAVRDARDKSPESIARLYGRSVRAIKLREAEDLYLGPLGMNTDTFVAQQKDMADSFIDRITNQLQSYEGEDVEAIVVGSDAENVHLYTVDTRGIAHCMDDVGFAAIGIGAWHAKSRLMQMGYTNRALLAQALASAFSAKKAADIAPGVGEFTDVHLVMKDAYFPLWENVNDKVHELYKRVEQGLVTLALDAIKELDQFIASPATQEPRDEPSKGSDGENSQANARPDQAAAKAAQGNESGKTAKQES
jgi:hypothetical protein